MAAQGFAAGFSRAMVWKVGTGGYALGTEGDDLTQGTTSGAHVLKNVQTGNLAYVDPTNLDITGGDRIVATFQFGSAKLGAFDLILADIDATLISILTNSNIDNTENAKYELFSVNPNLSEPPIIGLALIQRFQPQSTGSDGPDQYHTLIIPRAAVRVNMSGANYQAEAPVTLKITPTMTGKFITGQSFGDGANEIDLGLEDDKTDHLSIITAKPFHIAATKMAAAATGYTLPYKPLTNEVTVNNSSNWRVKNGVTTAATSVTPATAAVVIPSATADDIEMMLYTTAFVPSA